MTQFVAANGQKFLDKDLPTTLYFLYHRTTKHMQFSDFPQIFMGNEIPRKS